MGCGASSSAKASAPTALEGTTREENASRTPELQRDPATGAVHADPAHHVVQRDDTSTAAAAAPTRPAHGARDAVVDVCNQEWFIQVRGLAGLAPVATPDANTVSAAKQDDTGAAAAAAPTSAPRDNTGPVAAEDPLEKAAREAKQTFDARQQRLDAGTGASSSPAAGSQVPMYTQIGHEIARHAREQWKQKLDEPPSLDLKPRNAQQDMQILRGQLADKSVRTEVLHEDKRIVCFLLSSTFTDTASERNLLIADVVPYLQSLHASTTLTFGW